MPEDLQFALRTLSRNRVFTLAALASLGLGVGANTAVFSMMDAVLWRQLPVAEPKRLVQLAVKNDQGTRRPFPPALMRELAQDRALFAGLLTRDAEGISLRVDEGAERVVAEFVSGNYFSVLGVKAAVGRLFSPEVAEGRWQPEVVLSHDFWRRRFDLDPAVVGRVVFVDGQPYTVVGVSERGFSGVEVGSSYEVRIPQRDVETPSLAHLLARLAPGVEPERARATADSMLQRFLAADGAAADQRMRGAHVEVTAAARGIQRLRRRLEGPLLMVMLVAVLLLLLTCINVANLQVARALRRRQEIAIRLALGASRGSVVRQLLVESAVLALCGGVLGFFLALWVSSSLVALLPGGNVPVNLDIRPDLTALAFTFGIVIVSAALFGLVPALQATRQDLVSGLKKRTLNVLVVGKRRFEVAMALVVVQIAVSMVLLVLAGLFVQTLRNVAAVDPGFRPQGVAQFTLKHAGDRYTAEQVRAFCADLVREASGLPGVRAAGLAEFGPLAGRAGTRGASVPGSERAVDVIFDRVSPGLLDTLGVRLQAGRDFSVADRQGMPLVAVIDVNTARALFGSESALGRNIHLSGRTGGFEYEVVGVIQPVKQASLREAAERTVYGTIFQGDKPVMPTLYVASQAGAATVVEPVRRLFTRLDPEVPVFQAKTVQRRIDESLSTERLLASLSGSFGVVALFLVLVGILGVMSVSVAARAREIAIRISLGARAADVRRWVLGNCLRVVCVGVLLGVPGALAAGRWAASQLFGVKPSDPLTVLGIALLLAATAVLGGLLPAMHAARVDPLTTLKSE
jgi:predicted permease